MAHFFQCLLALPLFALLMVVPGYLWTETRPLRRRLDGPLRLPARFTLGFASWIAVVFALCAMGAFYVPVLYLLGALFVLAAAIVRARQHRTAPIRLRPAFPKFTPEESILSGTLTVALPILFLVTLVPAIAWDSNTYHLTVPKLYAESHGFRRIPFNVYSNWPLNIELLFGLALQLKDYILAKLVHFLFGLLILLALYRFTRSRGNTFAGLLAAVLFLGNPIVLFEHCIAYVDLAYAFFFFMGIWFVCEHARAEAGNRTFLLLAGICAGVLAGIKWTGPVAAGCLGWLVILTAGRPRTLRANIREMLVFFVLPCALLAAPWWIKSWYYTGNPIYPFLFDTFGGPEWSRELGAQFSAWHRSIGMGRGPADYLLLPIRVFLHSAAGYDRFDGGLNRAWILWLPLAIVSARRNRLVRHLLLIALLYFLFWSVTSQQSRLLIPVLPLLAVAAALSVTEWLGRLRGERRRRTLSAVVALGAVISLIACAAGEIRATAQLAQSRKRHDGQAEANRGKAPFDFINANLPNDARILFLNTNHGFFCEREYIADSFFEASQLGELLRTARTPDDVAALLDTLGITHVLWNDTDWGIDYPPALFDLFADRDRMALIYRSDDGMYALYTVGN